jgi:ribulose 1,5-bisphosphate synthetase/thiazole synthase
MVVEAKYRVAVVGGGPSGSCAAEIFAQNKDVDTWIIERKMDNCKPCGGAIPLCMVDEFNLPADIIDRKVRKMKMISPTNREVDIGQTLKPDEYIGMLRREVMDGYLRDRAIEFGAQPINGLVTEVEVPTADRDTYLIKYANYAGNKRVGTPEVLEVDIVIGADGANSRVAKAIDAGEYNYAIAFQERIKIDDEIWRSTRNLQRCMWAMMSLLTFTDGFSRSTTMLVLELELSLTVQESKVTRRQSVSVQERRLKAGRSLRLRLTQFQNTCALVELLVVRHLSGMLQVTLLNAPEKVFTLLRSLVAWRPRTFAA